MRINQSKSNCNFCGIFDCTGDLKTFHKNARVHYISNFPKLTNYENFLKLRTGPPTSSFPSSQYQLHQNRLHCTENEFYKCFLSNYHAPVKFEF